MPGRTRELGDLQLAVMRVLWSRPDASVQDVHEVLARTRDLAAPTVATVLGRLAERGYVSRAKQGRQYRWRAEVSEAEATGALVGDLTEKVFEGKTADLVCKLLEGGSFDANELERVRELLETRRAELARGKGRKKKATRKTARRSKGDT